MLVKALQLSFDNPEVLLMLGRLVAENNIRDVPSANFNEGIKVSSKAEKVLRQAVAQV